MKYSQNKHFFECFPKRLNAVRCVQAEIPKIILPVLGQTRSNFLNSRSPSPNWSSVPWGCRSATSPPNCSAWSSPICPGKGIFINAQQENMNHLKLSVSHIQCQLGCQTPRCLSIATSLLLPMPCLFVAGGSRFRHFHQLPLSRSHFYQLHFNWSHFQQPHFNRSHFHEPHLINRSILSTIFNLIPSPTS